MNMRIDKKYVNSVFDQETLSKHACLVGDLCELILPARVREPRPRRRPRRWTSCARATRPDGRAWSESDRAGWTRVERSGAKKEGWRDGDGDEKMRRTQ